MNFDNDQTQDAELGNYRILKKGGILWTLGKGAFGTTYKAEHKHLGGVYALKIINDQFTDSDEVKQRFLREAKATFSLTSSKIARIHDFGIEDGVFYYVLEYCSGGNLQEYSLANGEQPWSVVKLVALQILEGISDAHQNGFLHRDLKPTNIMLHKADDLESLKLIDFGMVKAIEDSGMKTDDSMLTVQGSFMGNPLTASPEQLHELELDERSDLFSLGVTLWYVLCGDSPFGKTATASLVHTRLEEKEYLDDLPKDLPDEGRFILGKLLSKKKEDRFASAEDVIVAIHEGRKVSSVVSASLATSQFDFSQENIAQEEYSEINESQDLQLIHGFSYGNYYSSINEQTNVRHTLYKPNERSLTELEQLLLDTKAEGNRVVNFTHLSSHKDEKIYYCQQLSQAKLSDVLKSYKKISIEDHYMIFQNLAEALDQAATAGFEKLELDDKYIHLGCSAENQKIPQSDQDWIDYLNADSLTITVLPRLSLDDEGEQAMKTIAGEDLAPNSITGFAALLYRLHTGMPIKQAAFLSKSAYIPSSLLSEKSNDYLREVIVSGDVPTSCSEMFHHLCELEINGQIPENKMVKKKDNLLKKKPVQQIQGDQIIKRTPIDSFLETKSLPLSSTAKVADNKSATNKTNQQNTLPSQKEMRIRLSDDQSFSTSTRANSLNKLKGILAAVLITGAGVAGFKIYQSSQKKDLVSNENNSNIGNATSSKGKISLVDLEPGPAVIAANMKANDERKEKMGQIKGLIEMKKYAMALELLKKLDLDTTKLKSELETLIKEELAFKSKQEKDKSMMAARKARLAEQRKLKISATEKSKLDAAKIWEKETSSERAVLELTNKQKEKSLNFIATNQPSINIFKRSRDGSIWEAKVVLKRPGNQPKEIKLKFNNNQLLKSNKEVIVKIIGPHIVKVDGKKQQTWELIVKDAVLEKKLNKDKNLVNEQRKKLFLKQQSLRKKYPELSEFFPF